MARARKKKRAKHNRRTYSSIREGHGHGRTGKDSSEKTELLKEVISSPFFIIFIFFVIFLIDNWTVTLAAVIIISVLYLIFFVIRKTTKLEGTKKKPRSNKKRK